MSSTNFTLEQRQTEWRAFLLATGKFKEDTDNATFGALATKKTTPGDIAARPQNKQEEWLLGVVIENDDREAILSALKQLAPSVSSPPGEVQTVLDGIPQLGPRTISNSFHKSQNHAPVNLDNSKPFKTTAKPLLRKISLIWIQSNIRTLVWNTVSSLAALVRMVLEDIITALSLNGVVIVQEEVTIYSLRPDLLVIMHSNNPIGIVEVKPPDTDGGSSILDNSEVHGQMYDNLRRLEEYFGLEYVFGVLTTYTAWRVFWLPTANAAANSDKLEHTHTEPASTIQLESDVFVKEEREIDLEDVNRVDALVCCGPVYRWDHLELPLVLCSVFWKMYCTPVHHVDITKPTRRLLCMTQDTCYWVASPFRNPNFTLKYQQLPTGNASKFILLKDLGFGAEGRVWLVCSATGQVGALKFHHTQPGGTQERAITAEFHNWQNIYQQGRIVRAGGFRALLMPYARRLGIPSESYSQEDAKLAVQRAVFNLAKKNKMHPDLAPRHVGVQSATKRGGKPRGLLTDLSKVEDFPPELFEDKLGEMFAKLGFSPKEQQAIIHSENQPRIKPHNKRRR